MAVPRLSIMSLGAVAALAGGLVAPSARAADGPMPIAEVRRMSAEALASSPEVTIRGTVIRAHSRQQSCIVQDDTGGLFIELKGDPAVTWQGWTEGGPPAGTLAPGDVVEVTGRVMTGGFAPMLVATVVRYCETAPLPEPRRVDATGFFQGVYGSTLVEVEGVVQAAIPCGGTWRVTMAAFGRPVTVDLLKSFLDGDPRDLIDAEVRVRGPTVALFNTRGEFLMPWITVNQPGGFTVVSPPPQPPFESPTVPLGRLAGFRTEADRGHMVRIEGTVIHAVPGEGVFLVEGDRGVRVLTAAIEGFVPGDRVVAAGFIDRSGPIARLVHACQREDHGQRLRRGRCLRRPARARRGKRRARHRHRGNRVVIRSGPLAGAHAAGGPPADPVGRRRGRAPHTVVVDAAAARAPGRRDRPRAGDGARVGVVAAPGGGPATRDLRPGLRERQAADAIARDRELRAEQRQRQELKAKLEASLTAAAIAHEIKQPLSHMVLGSKLAVDTLAAMGREGEPLRPVLSGLVRESERVVSTIERMRVLLRSVQTDHGPVDLADVARNAVLHASRDLERLGITITVRGADASCTIDGDDGQLQIALGNLLRNAAEAIAARPAGTRRIDVELAGGTAAGDGTAGFVELVVGDSGPGFVDPDAVSAPLASTKPGGTGVGLFVVRTVVENHGGTVAFGRSALGGAEVRCRFPRSRPTAGSPTLEPS